MRKNCDSIGTLTVELQYAFSRGFKNHGVIPLSTYLKQYRYEFNGK